MGNTGQIQQKGNLPPQDIEIEKAVLGALMVDVRAMDDVESFLNEKMFYLPKHQLVYKAIKNLFEKNYPVDLLTVSQTLREMRAHDNAGGDLYLIDLTQCVASSAHIERHGRILHELFIKRQLISIGSKLLKDAYREDISTFDLLENVGSELSSIEDVLSSNQNSMTWEEAMLSLPKHVERLTNNQGAVTGLPTGLTALDKHFSGWQKQDFIVIGADSGMGKTAFVMCSMLAAAQAGKSVGMFSMEMSVKQLAIRATAVNSNFHMNQLMRTGFEKTSYFETLYSVVDEMKGYPIHIDDKPALTVYEMKRKARALKRKFDIELLVIDFIQMFSGDKETRINVGEAARECKNIAKELNIPVIALSQISREVRKSRYHLPKKYHLKEASAIEEAADVIGMLYRPGYYGYTQANNPDLFDELGLMGEENAVLMVEKNRNGSLGNVGLRYVEDKTKYVDGYVEQEAPY